MDMRLFARCAAFVLLIAAVLVGPASAHADLAPSYRVLAQQGRLVYVDVGSGHGLLPGHRLRFPGVRGKTIVGEVQFVNATGRATVRVGMHEVVETDIRAVETREPTTASWMLPPNRRHGFALRLDGVLGLDKRSAQASAAVQWRIAFGGIAFAHVGEIGRQTFGDVTLATVDTVRGGAGFGWQWDAVAVYAGLEFAQVVSTVSAGPNKSGHSLTGYLSGPYYRIQLGPADGLNVEVEAGGGNGSLDDRAAGDASAVSVTMRAAIPVRDGTVLGLGFTASEGNADSDDGADATDTIRDRLSRAAGTLSVRHRLVGDDGPGTRYLRVGARAGGVRFVRERGSSSAPALPVFAEERAEASIEFGVEWRL